jgi:hypothetical protein
MADALLDRDADRIPARMELAMMVVSRQADTLASAAAATDAYTSALNQVAANERRMQARRDKAKRAMERLTAAWPRRKKPLPGWPRSTGPARRAGPQSPSAAAAGSRA